MEKKIINYLDPTLRNLKLDEDEKNAWIRDQYIHPIESLHTIDEVLNWFNNNNIEFISSIPSSDFDYDYNDIFQKNLLELIIQEFAIKYLCCLIN